MSLFLVEDEAIELNLMMNHIDWAGMGIEVVGSARNGKKAWEQIQTLQPDIVLSDVRMPFMDGLQLAALIQSRYERIKVVFLSGHDEFGYVKSALESGVVGYLLKPIDRAELAAVMAKAKAEADKEKLLRRSKEMLVESRMASMLTGTDSRIRAQAWLELTDMSPGFADQRYAIALISVDGYSAMLDRSPHADVSSTGRTIKALLESRGTAGTLIGLSAHEWVLALPFDDREDYEALWGLVSRAIKEACGWTATIGLADREDTLQQGRALFDKARLAADERFFVGPGGVVRAFGLHARLDLDIRTGEEAGPGTIDPTDRDRSVETVQRFFDLMTALRATKACVLQGAGELLDAVAAELAKYEDRASFNVGEPGDWSAAVERAETIGEVRQLLLDLIDKIGAHYANRRQDQHMQLAHRVTEIIDGEYGDALTIEYLAGKVYLSPNYLRVLFKEKKGCTIHEYLTRVRLYKSLELLRDKSLRIHDVARSVGYDNTSYFCSLFYKTQGVTPNEYRKKFL